MEFNFPALLATIIAVLYGVFAIARAVTRYTRSDRDDVVLGKIERIVFPILKALGPTAGTTSIRYGKGERIDPNRERKGEPKAAQGDE